MSRKRKSETNSIDVTTDATEQSSEKIPTATVAPPADAPALNQANAGHADRVGQRKYDPAPDPFGIATDSVARVRLFESTEDRQVALKFGDGSTEQKPSQAVIDKVKAAGFRWNPQHRIWTFPVRQDSARTTRIDAEKLFQEVRQMIRREKGLENGQGVPL
ncbi:MAG TPA: hypothetical protein VFE62_20080 [Gemmataceae bacterium]|nr:hypothetical protein [Gemmataceae bacterium]